MISGTFTAADQFSPTVGEGPVKYRLYCTAYTANTVEWAIGYHQLSHPRQLGFFLYGLWAATVDLQFSLDDGVTWDNVPNESYTANDARFFNG